MNQTFAELKKNLKKSTDGMPIVKLALLGDTATQFLAIAIKGEAINRGNNIDLYEAEYNQIERQLLDLSSEYHEFNAETTILFQSTQRLLKTFGKCSTTEREHFANSEMDKLKELLSCIRGRVIYYNHPEIDDTVFGNYANKVTQSFIYQLRKLNFGLMQYAEDNHNMFICDLSSIQNVIGRNNLYSPSIYVNTDMVLSIDSLPIIASRTNDIICALQGKFKKCLILDLDNTLWGGIIGDDGIENIQIGHGLGIGKAFSDFQLWAKKLKDRGVILAVCSKNTESIAKEPFEKHPDMVLRLDDIAVFMANWETKVDNIRQIQSILNIGFDSMVFLDDNPFERNMVRENIDQITVPELPADPANYLEYLYSLNLFETISYSSDDQDRTKQYQVGSQRTMVAKSFTNELDFLKSLNMESVVTGFTKFNIPRAAQLSQRSNQFNLRTIRYTEEDIANLEQNDNYKCFSFTLADQFGDNGLICVIILKKECNDTLFIDTWFMSCRVLKRGVEKFVLDNIIEYAKENRYKNILGEYIKTAKNEMVKNHYLDLGFVPKKDSEKNLFIFNVENAQEMEYYITKK